MVGELGLEPGLFLLADLAAPSLEDQVTRGGSGTGNHRAIGFRKASSPFEDTNLSENIWERPLAQVGLVDRGELEWTV